MISNKHFPLVDAITYEYVSLTAISQATIDCSITVDRGGKNVKLSIPAGVAHRLRVAVQRVSKFSSGYPACLAWVGDRVIGVECPDKHNLQPARENNWKSVIEINIGKFAAEIEHERDLYFDGQYVYWLTQAMEPETFDGNFGVLRLDKCRDMFRCNDLNWGDAARSCFAYKHAGKWTVTAPVTASTGSFIALVSDESVDISIKTAIKFKNMEDIDALRFVNLRFVNYAAGRLANAFDFETIEPLGLPLLMIEHGTFNLGELTPTIQMTCPAPMTFSQSLAWLVGLFNRVATMDQFIAVKEAIKMLTSKGCTRTAVVADDDGNKQSAVSKNKLIHDARHHFGAIPLVEF